MQKQITYPQHIMMHNIHYYSKREAVWALWGNIDFKTDRNPPGQTPNPLALCLTSKGLDGSRPPALLPVPHISLLGCFYSLCAAVSQLWDLQDLGVSIAQKDWVSRYLSLPVLIMSYGNIWIDLWSENR